MKDRKRSLLTFAAGILPFTGKYLIQGSIHSPEVFRLQQFLKTSSIREEDFRLINSYRKRLLQDKSEICFQHPYLEQEIRKRVCNIARGEGKKARSGKLLYSLVRYFKPAILVETGTSLGLSLCYQVLAMSQESRMISIEGAKELLAYTQDQIPLFPGKNLQLIQAKLPQDLPEVLADLKTVDWFFMDADHRYESVMAQMELLMPFVNEKTAILIDDIRWSEGMHEAWKELCFHPSVSHSIDFYDMGLLLFRRNTSGRRFYLIS